LGNRILTISQAYDDVSGAEAVFAPIQKLFSNLSNLKNVTCCLSKKLYC